ncbi:MAG: CocE/NonD family hydrolase [Candidatus Tectomicrobia bacterium]|nr:CocE/NonD family hydrolase [Candidatus Tectomicrobia bacterium]
MTSSPQRGWHPDSVRHIHPAVWPQWPFDEPPAVRERSEPRYNIRAEADQRIKMRDGVHLAADVYRPRTAGQKFPALLSISPYTRQLQVTEVTLGQNEAGLTEFWVPRGYAHVIVDVRGSNDSGGSYDDKGEKEQGDYLELIEWAASQPWCNGKVGMIGCSYFALVQLLSAVHQPDALAAIFPYDAYTDLYRHRTFHGGVPYLGFMRSWFAAVGNLNFQGGRLQDRSGLDKMMRDHLNMEHLFDGEFFQVRSPEQALRNIKIPTYFGCDWSFWWLHLPGAFNGWEGTGKIPKRMLIGPRPQPWRPFGAYHEEALRWYDHWLKGMDTGVMEGPPIQLWIPGEDRWRGEEDWPLPRTKFTKLYLGGQGGGPQGTLSDTPGGGGERTFAYRPFTREWRLGEPRLVYRSEPMTAPYELTGPISLHLAARSSAEDTDWMVHFQDEAPDGSRRTLTKGWLRASHRELDVKLSKPGRPWHPHTRAVPLTPGKEEAYAIELCPTCNVFQPGHRVRLEVSSAFPFAENLSYHESPHLPADNTVLEGKEGSFLLVPVIPR